MLTPVNIISGGLNVTKISLWYNSSDGMLFGIQLFNDKNENLLTTGYSIAGKSEHVI